MYLVPQHQLDALKHTTPRESVRQSAENELDKAIEVVLNSPDADLYEKAKKYGSVLQRYLSMVKQGLLEQGSLTLSLSEDTPQAHTTTPVHLDNTKDDRVYDKIMKHIPQRSRKNAAHIMELLKKSQDVSWSDKGEFVLRGVPFIGSHMYDLLKNVTATHHVLDTDRPPGWHAFLKSLASNNILSTSTGIPSKQLRHTVDLYKHTPQSDDVIGKARQGNFIYIAYTRQTQSASHINIVIQ